jgi:pentapeptide MXKDX repeat protein
MTMMDRGNRVILTRFLRTPEKLMKKLLASMMCGCLLAAGSVAFADDMSKDAMAKHDQMMKDCMAKQDSSMSKDASMKMCKDTMAKDAMSKDKMNKDAMQKDAMKK